MNVTVDNAVGQGSALGLILGLDITVSVRPLLADANH